MKLAAVTLQLDWSFRQTCSGERFDRAVAERYIAQHVEKGLALMDRAGQMGADLVLGPEYFRGSELFISTPANIAALSEPPDGPTALRMGQVAARHRMYVAAAYYARHGDRVEETGILVDRDGRFMGHHIKRGPAPWPPGMPPGTGQTPPLPLWDLTIGRAGFLVCSDCENPANPLDMARRGMKIILLPGCGFMGKFFAEFVIVRALEHHCAVVYADENRAMIVDAKGEVLARTDRTDDVIAAEIGA